MTTSPPIRLNPPELLTYVATLTALTLTGCQMPQQQAKEEATQRWNQARAQVKAKLACDQFGAGNIKAAAGELAEARQLDPANPTWTPLQARIWLAEGNTAAAAELLDRTNLAGPAQAEVEYLRGVVYQQQQRWNEALAAFQQAAALDPGEVAYVVAVVQVWLQLGQPQDALRYLEASAGNFAWTDAYQAALAECLEGSGDWAGAALAWRRVARSSESDTDIRERLAHALCRAGQYTDAIPVLQGLVTSTTVQQSVGMRLHLAEAHLAVSQPDAARAEVQTVLQYDPDQPAALLLLAQAWAMTGDRPAALRSARRALQFEPQNTDALEMVAALEWTSGETRAARERALRLRAVDPESPIAAHILAQCPD